MSRDDARAAAARQFGYVTWHREEIHVMNGVRLMDELIQDLPYALRQIRHSTGFSLAVVATLALGACVYRPTTMTEVVGRSVRTRALHVPVGTSAFLSLTLAALGLYGVRAYSVRERTPEIGIRMAPGATRTDDRAVVFRQAAVLLGIGVVVGSAGSVVLGRWLSSLAFGVSPSDPRVIGATALLLTATAFLASWVPARRASRVEPRIAMQERC
jgi:ABC-type antimicrobial peptide transport system permease subunit